MKYGWILKCPTRVLGLLLLLSLPVILFLTPRPGEKCPACGGSGTSPDTATGGCVYCNGAG